MKRYVTLVAKILVLLNLIILVWYGLDAASVLLSDAKCHGEVIQARPDEVGLQGVFIAAAVATGIGLIIHLYKSRLTRNLMITGLIVFTLIAYYLIFGALFVHGFCIAPF